MPRTLTIRADIESEYTIGLRAEVVSEGFSGHGEAWFNMSEVQNFITQLRHFASTTESPPHIQGGNWDGDGNLSEVLLSLRFYSLSDYRAGVHIHLVDCPSTNARTEEVSKVIVGLKPTKHEVLSFCDDMDRLLSSELTEANLITQ